MSYDVFADDSEHVVIGYQQMRLGYIAYCLGIPASTLAGLRDGSLVAVPRPVFPPRFWSSGVGPNGIRYFAVEWPLATKTARDDMLAAAAAPKGGEK